MESSVVKTNLVGHDGLSMVFKSGVFLAAALVVSIGLPSVEAQAKRKTSRADSSPYTTMSMDAGGDREGSGSLDKEFDTLGDNKELIKRVKNLDSQQEVRVVQNRLVNRVNRLEINFNFGYVSNGDPYVQTSNLGVGLDYHLNSRWTFGVEYQHAQNSGTREGQQRYEEARSSYLSTGNLYAVSFPQVGYPIQSQMANISFYPFYGKMNLFDLGISQFDVYTKLGVGQIEVGQWETGLDKRSEGGKSSLYSLGFGVGFWFSPWFVSRVEYRIQKYQDLLADPQVPGRDMNVGQIVISAGAFIW